MPYTTLIVGLGKMGLAYDYDQVDDTLILSHAKAFNLHPGFELVGGVDPEVSKRQDFTQKYCKFALPTLSHLNPRDKPDVIVIAVPPEAHYDVLNDALSREPKAILCEKPFTTRNVLAKEILMKAKAQGCLLLINYIRRFEPGVLALKKALSDGVIGEINKVIIHFSRGLLNTGSHFLDLVQFIVGQIQYAKRIDDHKGKHCDAHLQIGDCSVYLLGNENLGAFYEMSIYGTRGVVRYERGGNAIFLQQLRRDPVFAGYETLSPERVTFPNGMNRYQWHVCDHLFDLLQAGQQQGNAESACQTLEIIEHLLQEVTPWQKN